MNRIERLFRSRNNNILSIDFTAGFPQLDDTLSIIRELDKYGVDMIEIGMPFSDPVADGPIIQQSSEKALKNGMSLNLLFTQLEKIRKMTDIPLILMGYINPFFRFGIENLLERCIETGIDGTIIPDLPVEEYMGSYETMFDRSGIINIFLLTPQTPPERITYLDSISKGFLYIVSTSSTTGTRSGFDSSQPDYFRKIRDLNLKTPGLIGFGISDKESFDLACTYANGAIIGSAFIKSLDEKGTLSENIERFIRILK